MNISIINRCPICGGSLSEVPTKPNIRECDACGNAVEYRPTEAEHQFVEAVTLYNNFEFEKAYDRLDLYLKSMPNDTEAYFLRCLAYHKIKFELDTRSESVSYNNTPTFFGKMESIKENPDYQRALSLSRNNQSMFTYYQSQADKIDRMVYGYNKMKERIKKGQLPAYDIFICYKHSELFNGNSNGNFTTPDFTKATEIYTSLLEKRKYHVFLAAKSIPVGEEYEPYIYNALDSSKVLIIFASKKEYIDAPWLKNERRRFMSDKSKKVIVLYDGDFNTSTDLPMDLKSIQATKYDAQGFVKASEEIDKFLSTKTTQNIDITFAKNLDIKRKRLESILTQDNKSYENYYNELKSCSDDIRLYDESNRLAKFGYAISELHFNNPEPIKQFLDNEKIPFDPSNRYSNIIMQFLIDAGEPRIQKEVKAYISKVVKDNFLRDKFVGELDFNTQKKFESLEKNLQSNDIFIYCPDRSAMAIEEYIDGVLSYEKYNVWTQNKNLRNVTGNRNSIIEDAIKNCEVFIYILSDDFMSYLFEATNIFKLVKSKNKPIIEFNVNDAKLPTSVLSILGSVEKISCKNNYMAINVKKELVYQCRTIIESTLSKDDIEKQRIKTLQDATVQMEKIIQNSELIKKLADDVLTSDANLGSRDIFEKTCIALSFIENSNFEKAKTTFINMTKSENEFLYYLTQMTLNLWSAFEEKDPSKRRLEILAGQDAFNYIMQKYPYPTDEEIEYIKRIEKSDSIAIIAISFRMLNETNRYRMLRKYIQLDKLYSMSVRNQLVKILIMETDFASIEEIIRNCPEIDYSVIVDNIFKIKGNESQKANILNSISNEIKLSENITEILNEELSDAKSLSYMKALINFMYKNKLKIDIASVTKEPLLATEEVTDSILTNMKETKFNNWDIDAIVDFSINSNNAEIMHKVLSWLYRNNYINEIGPHNIKKFTELQMEDFTDKLRILKDIAEFNVTIQSMTYFIGTYLANPIDTSANRLAVISMINEFCKYHQPAITINMKCYETYIVTNTIDGLAKVEIIKKLAEITGKYEKFDELIKKYISSSRDSVEIQQQIISTFIDPNNLNAEIVNIYINMPTKEYDKNYVNILNFYLSNNPVFAFSQIGKYLESSAPDPDGVIANTIIRYIGSVNEFEFANLLKNFNEDKLEKVLPILIRKFDNPKKCTIETIWQNEQVEMNLLQCFVLFSKHVTDDFRETFKYLSSKRCYLDDKIKFIGLRKKFSFYDVIMKYDYAISPEIKGFCEKYI